MVDALDENLSVLPIRRIADGWRERANNLAGANSRAGEKNQANLKLGVDASH